MKVLLVLLLLLLTACDLLPPEGRKAINAASKVLLGELKSELNGDKPPSPTHSTHSSGSSAATSEQTNSTPSVVGESSSATTVSNAKANSEILHEMLQVVFMREPKNRAEFGNWADTLNQGASLEGVYNGLTHSAEYRKLEVANAGASPKALNVFVQELAILELELPEITEFDATSAAPLPILGNAEVTNPTEVIEFKKRRNSNTPDSARNSQKPSSLFLAEKYAKVFVGASIFTLKRVISDEALKVIDSKSQYRQKFAFWYSKWVVHMTQRNVDFGIPLRNKPDEAFHFKWAMQSATQSSDDRIKWEVLNRLHRVLNDANVHK